MTKNNCAHDQMYCEAMPWSNLNWKNYSNTNPEKRILVTYCIDSKMVFRLSEALTRICSNITSLFSRSISPLAFISAFTRANSVFSRSSASCSSVS